MTHRTAGILATKEDKLVAGDVLSWFPDDPEGKFIATF